MTLAWGMLMTPFVGWLDMGKSYRAMIADLRPALPDPHQCINSRALGEPQRAMLQYFAGRLTEREEAGKGGSCKFLLVQGSVFDPVPSDLGQKIWEGARLGDNFERYRLYQRSF
jgi:hypothetical protein